MAEILAYVASALADEAAGADAHFAALENLVSILTFTHSDTLLSIVNVDYFAMRLPVLVAADQQGNVPLLAARAIAEAVEILPQWAETFEKHGAVQALRDRLLAVDNIELAEECLGALKTISEECPDQCLRHGVAAAVLQFFDFFSASKQKDALKIVAELVEECEEVDVPKAMEAAPALCNLLQSADKTILESALSCLSMLASDAHGKAEHMDRLCESNVVEAAMRLLEKDGWKTIGDDTLLNILGLLKDLASASPKAVKSLFDLGVCDLLKQMITHYTSSHGNNDKLQKLLELIHQLMRPLETSDTLKKNAVIEKNAYMDQLASIVTLIVHVGKSGALASVCYGCVVVIGNIVESSTPTFLMELQNTSNLSSFLTCLLARKNRHVMFQTLKVSKSLLKKHHHFFFESFTKEGVKHAIDAIQEQEKDRNSNHKLKRKNKQEHCVCFEFQSDASSRDGCKIQNNAILNLAEEIKKSFFLVKATNKSPHRLGCFITTVKGFWGRVKGHTNDTMTTPTQNLDQCRELSEVSRRLLSDKLPSTSTFVFAKSGSAKDLSDYLSNGGYLNQNLNNCQDLLERVKEVQCRLQKFAHLALTMSDGSSAKPLEILVEKLIDALHMSYHSFPVILSHHNQCTRQSTMIPLRRTENSKTLHIKFVKARREKDLQGYGGVLSVPISSKPEEIETDLWPKICSPRNGQGSSRLIFCYKGTELKSSATIFESLVHLMNDGQSDITIDQSFWNEEYRISYKRNKSKKTSNSRLSSVHEKLDLSLLKDPFFGAIILGKLPGDVEESDPSYDLLFTLKVLEGLNRFSYQLSMDEKIRLFAESCQRNLDDLKVTISPIPQRQFISSLLTNKLELQMQDKLFKDGLIPSWCVHLVETCPFLFSFDARWKYFCLTVQCSFMADKASAPHEPSSSDEESDASDEESDAPNEAAKGTNKHEVARGNLLENAAAMMAKHAASTTTIEVVFEGEVGTGRGPTFEFYSTVSHELQRFGIGMWRGDNARKAEGETGFIHSSFGLFPQPWPPGVTSSRGIEFSDVVQKFKLLGYIVARAVLDGRILDIALSKAFYKIMLGQELDIYDIPSFDPELGKTILEFQALVKRKKFLETSSESTSNLSADLSYKNTRLEDLCLDFTLPGNPEYVLVPGGSEKMVTLDNLEEYIRLIVDATLKSGIAKQIEAFKSSVNEVFALKTLRMFSEEEMERILCGEQDSWASSRLEDHIEFEHGYDGNSPPIVSFLEVLREFGREEQRAFIQFTTGAPQLPLGGLASLDPKLTVVRKQCDCNVDCELPSVNTCRHFIKLPPYSSKKIMKERLKYAITEGLGSFHLS